MRACLVVLLCAAAVSAQESGGRGEPLPPELEGVGITEHLGDRVPLDAAFVDETGQPVTLAAYLDGSRPVVLNLMYMGCPMLCGLVSNGLLEALQQIDHTAGNEFTIVSLSIDPSETPTLAKAKQNGYLREYGRPGAAQGWHFLTGEEAQIRRVTDAVGFGYRWNEKRQEFAHAAALIILTPDGTVSRYLYGIQFDPRTLKLSLVEAADGKTASTLDRFILFCFHYDAAAGRYGPAAANLMKASGVLAVIALGILILRLRRREPVLN
jgi:protein SCO1